LAPWSKRLNVNCFAAERQHCFGISTEVTDVLQTPVYALRDRLVTVTTRLVKHELSAVCTSCNLLVLVADDFKETVGIERITEALSCHSWPNLIMKGSN